MLKNIDINISEIGIHISSSYEFYIASCYLTFNPVNLYKWICNLEMKNFSESNSETDSNLRSKSKNR